MTNTAAALQKETLGTEALKCKSLLLLTDFSKQSKVAFQYAADFARLFGSTLHMLHAISPLTTADYGCNAPAMCLPDIEELARKEMMALANAKALDGVEHTEDVDMGPLTVLAAEMYDKYRVDMMVCASHAPGFAERLTFGSVAEWVARSGAPPTILIGKEVEPKRFAFKRVLFATALKADSLRSAQYAAGIAAATGAELTLMHVIEDRHVSAQAAAEKLSTLVPENFKSPKLVLHSGDAVMAILVQAEKMEADLIVMGLRSGFMAHHAPWSKVSEIVAHAQCPVLAVPEHF